jgi:hypothetical protein
LALTYQAHLAHLLIKAINEEIRARTDNLVSGHTALDFPTYKHHVGVIEGLKRALELIDETETAIEKGQ